MVNEASSAKINLSDILEDIEVPKIDIQQIDASIPVPKQKEDIFAEKKRKAWNVDHIEPRCDFSPNKARISFRNPAFAIVSLWKKSLYGRTLSDIKQDDNMIPFFAEGMVKLINQMLGHSLSSGDWCIVTSPKRRHKERNFATLISIKIADALNIPFYEDLALCHSKQRVGAVFDLNYDPPKQKNIIVFDDFVTSGSTMISMYNLLSPLGYNLVFFTGINNRM